MTTNPLFKQAAQWQPRKIDLGIAGVVALVLPIAAGFLYRTTGALLPMLIYYGLAWGLVKWRRGSTGYHNPLPKRITLFFFVNLAVICLSLLFAYLGRITVFTSNVIGVTATALICAPLNSATEQLLWIYIFESWDLYSTKSRWFFRLVGLVLFTAFVGLIHTMFWAKFLTTVDSKQIFGLVFILLTTVSGFLHLVVWRKSKNMFLTFIPHFLLNLAPLFWTKYSILPFLIH